MPRTRTRSGIDSYRKIFEEYLEKQISFLQWSRYKTEFLETGLALNAKNLKLFANFKKHCPRHVLNKFVLNTMTQFQLLHRSKTEWLGKEVFETIRKLNPQIDEWQMYRAFYRAGLGFKSSRRYSKEQVFYVIFYALLYGENSTNERKSDGRL